MFPSSSLMEKKSYVDESILNKFKKKTFLEMILLALKKSGQI